MNMNSENQLDFIPSSNESLLGSFPNSLFNEIKEMNESDTVREERRREQSIMAARRHRARKNERLSSLIQEIESIEKKNDDLKEKYAKIEFENCLIHDNLKRELSDKKYKTVFNAIELIRSSAYEDLEYSVEEARRLLSEDGLIPPQEANYNIPFFVYGDGNGATMQQANKQNMINDIAALPIDLNIDDNFDDFHDLLLSPDVRSPMDSFPELLFNAEEGGRILFHDDVQDKNIDDLSILQIEESLKMELHMNIK